MQLSELSRWQHSSSARLVMLQHSSVSQTFRAQKTRSSANSVARDGNAARGFHTLAVWTTQQVAAFRPDPKLLHRTGVGLARSTAPPVSHLPKELQTEAAFFSEQCIITESTSERGLSYFFQPLSKATNTVGLATR